MFKKVKEKILKLMPTKEKELSLNEWQQQVACFFKALIPGLFVQTSEESRVMTDLVEIVQWLAQKQNAKRDFLVWSDVTFKKYELFKEGTSPASTAEDGFSNGPEYQVLENKDFATCVLDFAKFDDTEKKIHRPTALVMCDPGAALQNPVAVRALRESLNALQGTKKTIILLGLQFSLPRELSDDVSVIPFELPTYAQLYAVVNPILKSYKDMLPKAIIQTEVAPAFCRACSGISERESRALVSLSLSKHGGFDSRAVTLALKEKERIVKRSDVLECVTPNKNLASVGGLENVKAWVQENTAVLRDTQKARDYGLKLPSGLLLLGVPGTGKSLTAKALAAEWQVPLLICDVGNLFASHVGESEGRVREMIRIAIAARPCVLFIDEFEKSLGGDSLDGGTSQRVKASFLNFMQEKPDEVFIVATANDIRKLGQNPEFIRRFDASFFVDLPGLDARSDIFRIHLDEAGHPMSHAEVLGAAMKSVRYSGAEISTICQKSLRVAFGRGLKHPTSEILEDSVKSVVPLSTTMKESIQALRDWCKQGRAQPASESSLEFDELKSEENHQRGIPDLGNN